MISAWWSSAREALGAPRDIAWLVALRIMLGLLIAWSAARFLLYGWVERFYVEPAYFFPYWGFEWLPRPSAWLAHGLFGALVALGLMVASGALYRVAIVASFMIFTYLELLDVTNYLNHYYLLSALTFLMIAMPAHGAYSVDAWLWPALRRATVPAWTHWLMRFQVASVYFWAGMAKAGSDWLVHGQPLKIWLLTRQETPLVGWLFELQHVPLLMSWGGFLFDSTIWIWLLWPRTRRAAYVVVLVFHAMTGLLFHIGMFPLIMTCAATVLFSADWCKRVFSSSWTAAPHTRSLLGDAAPPQPPPGQQATQPVPECKRSKAHHLVAFIALYMIFQTVMPLRYLAYPGNVLWHEQGMRWSWRVMLREKSGDVLYRVTVPEKRYELHIPPTRYLTDHQAREMSAQPDMILRLAHHIGEDFLARGHARVEVRVDAFAALNGRPPALLIDPTMDLMQVEDGLAPAPWILPAPAGPPPSLQPKHCRELPCLSHTRAVAPSGSWQRSSRSPPQSP